MGRFCFKVNGAEGALEVRWGSGSIQHGVWVLSFV